jgi:DNA repair protein RadC
MNIDPTILRNQIEELMNVQGIGEQSFLKLKALVTIAPAKTAER